MDKAFLRASEVADILGIGKSLAYTLINSGQIKSVYVAGTRARRVPSADLKEWIDGQADNTHYRPRQS